MIHDGSILKVTVPNVVLPSPGKTALADDSARSLFCGFPVTARLNLSAGDCGDAPAGYWCKKKRGPE